MTPTAGCRTRKAPRVRQAEETFTAQGYPVITIPFDKHLHQGGVIEPERIWRTTRTAYEQLASVVTTP